MNKEISARQKVMAASREADAICMLAELKNDDMYVASNLDRLVESIALHNARNGGKPKEEYFDVLYYLLDDVRTLMKDSE